MSLTKERINEIAIECWQEAGSANPITMCNLFLSRIREEQEAVATIQLPDPEDEHDWLSISNADWKKLCTLPAKSKLFTIPPAAPECKGTEIRWVTNGVVFGSPTASDALEYVNNRLADSDEAACMSGDARLRQMDSVKALFANCNELVEALENTKLFAEWIEILGRTECEIYKHELKSSADRMMERIDEALTKHKAMMEKK